MNNLIKRGEIYYADLSGCQGSEQGGIRPVLIIQNNIGNKYSPTTLVAPITSKVNKKQLPTHVLIDKVGEGLKHVSTVLVEQSRVIDKNRLGEYVSCLDEESMINVDNAIITSFGIIIRSA